MNKGRKITGGKYHRNRKKKSFEIKGQENLVSLGELKVKQKRTKGGDKKTILLKSNKINILSGKKVQEADILNVIETPQNTFLARQNRLMKGVKIETSLGKAKITNRPSREGAINGVLIKE